MAFTLDHDTQTQILRSDDGYNLVLSNNFVSKKVVSSKSLVALDEIEEILKRLIELSANTLERHTIYAQSNIADAKRLVTTLLDNADRDAPEFMRMLHINTR